MATRKNYGRVGRGPDDEGEKEKSVIVVVVVVEGRVEGTKG